MNTLLLYGRSDVGKTTQLGEIAKYLVSLGLKGRYFSADSGWGPLGNLTLPGNGVEAVNVEALCTPTEKIPLGRQPQAVLSSIADGYWFVEKDGKIKFMPAPGVDFYIGEGLDSFANLCMQSHVRHGRKIGEDTVGKYTSELLNDDGTEVRTYTGGNPGRAHYGEVQRFILEEWLPRMKSLRTKFLILTAHEAQGEDDFGKKAFGPALIGSAKAAYITEKFQDSLHMVKIPRLRGTVLENEYRAYFGNHPHMITETTASQTDYWPAKLSLPLEDMAKVRESNPGGFFTLSADGKKSAAEVIRLRLKGAEKETKT